MQSFKLHSVYCNAEKQNSNNKYSKQKVFGRQTTYYIQIISDYEAVFLAVDSACNFRKQ